MRLSQISGRGAPNIGLKEVQQWKKDLRRMTKIYRSIDPSPWDYGYGAEHEIERARTKELAKFKEAHKLFITFANNFQKWYRYELLPIVKENDQISDSQRTDWRHQHHCCNADHERHCNLSEQCCIRQGAWTAHGDSDA